MIGDLLFAVIYLPKIYFEKIKLKKNGYSMP